MRRSRQLRSDGPAVAGHAIVGPRHTGRAILAEPDQRPPHRLARLLLTAGGAAAGMCLVVGLVALMVALGARQHASSATGRLSEQPGKTLTSRAGKGGHRASVWSVGQRSLWGLAWRFRCPAGRSGTFTVRDADSTVSPALAHKSGDQGSGVWWSNHDPGVQLLRIVSGCPWHVRVFLPASVHSSASPRPAHSPGSGQNRGHGHGHGRKHGHGQQRGHSHKPKPSHKPKHSPAAAPSPGSQR